MANVEHVLVSSLVVGYVGVKIFKAIPINISYTIDLIGMVISTIIVALLVGKMYESYAFQKVLDFLKIRRDVSDTIWEELGDPDRPFQIRLTYGNVVYQGFSHEIEPYKNLPVMSLYRYKKYVDGELVLDNFDNYREIIVLDSSKANDISVIYDPESKKVKEVDGYLDNWK